MPHFPLNGFICTRNGTRQDRERNVTWNQWHDLRAFFILGRPKKNARSLLLLCCNTLFFFFKSFFSSTRKFISTFTFCSIIWLMSIDSIKIIRLTKRRTSANLLDNQSGIIEINARSLRNASSCLELALFRTWKEDDKWLVALTSTRSRLSSSARTGSRSKCALANARYART